jgi:hypothetical protein
VTVSAAVASLVGNTTYHFRVVATNVNGTAYGADQTFTTQLVLAQPARARVMMMGLAPLSLPFTSHGGWIWGHLND